MTWFTADTHFGHSNIVEGISLWKDKSPCRPFKTLEEHDITILNSINKYVKEDDTLYIIGDFSLGGFENVFKYRQLINCTKIHFALGNHDHHIRKNKLFKQEDGTEWLMSDLFSSISERIEKTILKHDFVMDHYAMRTWHNAGKGTIMLHGHSHGQLDEYEEYLRVKSVLVPTNRSYRTMDVGLDAIFNLFGEYRPISTEEIIQIMEKRIPLQGIKDFEE